MSGAKFTPGPWKREPRAVGGVDWDAVIRSANRDPIALVTQAGFNKSEGHANARLIAAAPRMFELLERLSVCIEQAEQYQLEGEAERLLAEIRGEA